MGEGRGEGRAPAGSKGYDIEADALVRRYEHVRPLDKYRVAQHLVPSTPCRVMDVGAGSGADAAWFASLGHEVLAIEPTFEMRRRAMLMHTSPRIEWMDDCLPHLRSVVALDRRFDLIIVAAVWMHLDELERRAAFGTLTSLVALGGTILISVRQGPAPAGRLVFAVSVPDTIASAEICGLRTTLNAEAQSLQAANRAAGVTWRWLAFQVRPGR